MISQQATRNLSYATAKTGFRTCLLPNTSKDASKSANFLGQQGNEIVSRAETCFSESLKHWISTSRSQNKKSEVTTTRPGNSAGNVGVVQNRDVYKDIKDTKASVNKLLEQHYNAVEESGDMKRKVDDLTRQGNIIVDQLKALTHQIENLAKTVDGLKNKTLC